MIEITEDDYQRAEANGIKRHTLRNRVRKLKWDKERAINDPILTNAETIKRAAAATPFRHTNKLHFLKEATR
jgi:hypothetical protein